MPNLAHVAARIFGTPLLMHEAKLHAILGGLGPRLGLQPQAFDDDEGGRGSRPPQRPYLVTGSGVAIIPVVGILVNRAGQITPDSQELRSYSTILRDMAMADADPAVRGMVFDVDSPGGECANAFELSAKIRSMRGRKPMIAVANGYAYSAAYAVASAADQIWLPESGGVGSIGIVAVHVDQSKRDAQQGLAFDYIFAGSKKVDGHSHAPLSEGARADLLGEVQRLYGMFTSLVAANRGISEAEARATEAGCFYGSKAISARLADRIGTLSEAVTEVARLADAAATSAPGGLSPRDNTSLGNNMTQSNSTAPDAAEGAPVIAAGTTTQPPAGAPQGAAQPGTAAPGLTAEDCAAIAEICALAGRAGEAPGFIRAGKTRGEVSEALLRARATTQEQTPISGAHGIAEATGTRSADPADPHGWNASTDRVCGKQGI
jgi:signal peptide peptidase SppA